MGNSQQLGETGVITKPQQKQTKHEDIEIGRCERIIIKTAKKVLKNKNKK